MRPPTLLLAAFVAVAAAAVFPITLSAGKDDAQRRVASPAAAAVPSGPQIGRARIERRPGGRRFAGAGPWRSASQPPAA